MRQLIPSFLLALLCVSPGCVDETPAELSQKEIEQEVTRLETKRLDDFYEMEWIKCVNEMGLDRCRAIQETGFVQCLHQRTTDRNGRSHNDCIDERFQDRLKTLPVEDETSSPQLPEAPEHE